MACGQTGWIVHPSGTLIVVGPVEFSQDEWDCNAGRLQMACLHALNSGHRIAVLLETPAPEQLHRDVRLFVESDHPESEGMAEALIGVVNEGGNLKLIHPSHPKQPAPVARRAALKKYLEPRSTSSIPSSLWSSERLRTKTLLKRTFSERLSYVRNGGFRTANFTLPFRVLMAPHHYLGRIRLTVLKFVSVRLQVKPRGLWSLCTTKLEGGWIHHCSLFLD